MGNDNDKTVVVEGRGVEARSSSSGPITAIVVVVIIILLVLAVLAYNMFTSGGSDTTEGDTTGTTVITDIPLSVEGGSELTPPAPNRE